MSMATKWDEPNRHCWCTRMQVKWIWISKPDDVPNRSVPLFPLRASAHAHTHLHFKILKLPLGAHIIIHAYCVCIIYFLCCVVYLLILNSLNLLQLSHRTSHASVCKIIHLEHFNRAQNIFVRKLFMLYLAMKLPEYDRCKMYSWVCALAKKDCVYTWFLIQNKKYLKRSKVTNNTSLISDNKSTAPLHQQYMYNTAKMNIN